MYKRVFRYFLGLLIMTLGIALSVKSDLGVSPVSSIPYTMTCVIGMEMGRATILFHAVLVLIQFLLLGKQFRKKNLLQVLVGVVFGSFTTLFNQLLAPVMFPDLLVVRLILSFLGAFFIALGIHFYVPADIMPIAAEGTILAISEKFNKQFSTVKILFDVTMVSLSLIICLVFIHSAGSVGIGTVLAAFLVGIELKWIKIIAKRFAKAK